MTEPYVGELRMFGFNFPPVGWTACQGQLVPIAENEVLFVLLGTTYGGDGIETFGLPDLQGRGPVGLGQGPGLASVVPGQVGGVEQVTLIVNQIPAHTHPVAATTTSTTKNPTGTVPGVAGAGSSYGATPTVAMSPSMISPVGGNQPHDNRPPYLGVNWCISNFGIFPSRQ